MKNTWYLMKYLFNVAGKNILDSTYVFKIQRKISPISHLLPIQ